MKLLAALLLPGLVACASAGSPAAGHLPALHVRPTDDFEVTGSGDAPAWNRTEWTPLRRRQADGLPYDTRLKLLYSQTGIYVLLDGTDRKLTTTGRPDFSDLWEEDVY